MAVSTGCGGGSSPATGAQTCNPKIAAGTPKSIALSSHDQPIAQFAHDHPEWTGGLWLDNEKAHIVIVLVPGTNRAALNAAIAETGIAASDIEYRHAARSEAELEKERRQFESSQMPKLAKEGYQVTSVGSRPESNLNCVGVANLSASDARKLEKRYPTMRFYSQAAMVPVGGSS